MGTVYIRVIIAIICLFMLTSCNSNSKEPDGRVELVVSAAVSLKGALIELKKEYEEENKDIKLLFNFGSSGALAQQIVQGAPVDLYFSAAKEPFVRLQEKGLIDSVSSTDLLGNELVLIQPGNRKENLESFKGLTKSEIRKIAIGTPETVPAGKYAKEVLEKTGIWTTLQEKLVLAKDASQILSYVESGNVDAGIVYKTDAMHSKSIIICAVANKELHSSIVYPIGIVSETDQKKKANELLSYLQSEKALDVYKKYGFSISGGK